jgi:hypothetical protein
MLNCRMNSQSCRYRSPPLCRRSWLLGPLNTAPYSQSSDSRVDSKIREHPDASAPETHHDLFAESPETFEVILLLFSIREPPLIQISLSDKRIMIRSPCRTFLHLKYPTQSTAHLQERASSCTLKNLSTLPCWELVGMLLQQRVWVVLQEMLGRLQRQNVLTCSVRDGHWQHLGC